MSLRNIIIEPDPILREKSLPVEKVDSDLQKLLNEISSLSVSIKSPFEANSEDILNADGLLIGTTENLASMAGATKDFFDRNYYNVIEKKEGMPVAVWIRAGHDGTGTTIQMKSIIKGLKKINHKVDIKIFNKLF